MIAAIDFERLSQFCKALGSFDSKATSNGAACAEPGMTDVLYIHDVWIAFLVCACRACQWSVYGASDMCFNKACSVLFNSDTKEQDV